MKFMRERVLGSPRYRELHFAAPALWADVPHRAKVVILHALNESLDERAEFRRMHQRSYGTAPPCSQICSPTGCLQAEGYMWSAPMCACFSVSSHQPRRHRQRACRVSW